MKTTTTPALIIPKLVVPVVRTKIQCRDDPELRDMLITDGPAAHEVQGIKQNLVLGCAIPQTVVMLKEEAEPQVLSMVSICPEGQPHLLFPQMAVPPFLRKLATGMYINVLGRADGFRGAVLRDGETHLGTVTIRAAVEQACILNGGRAPTMYAAVKKTNGRAKRAFIAVGFYRHRGSDKLPDGDIMVRRAGVPLRAAPPRQAYETLLPRRQKEHSLAA